jgi:dolichol-phosphate mannosyltransferase
MQKITKVPALSHAADFRIMNRSVVDILNQLPEQKKVFRFLIPELGFKIGTTEIRRDARFAGETKYGIKKMVSLAIDSAITYSYKPLRLASITGVIFGILLFGLAIGSAGLYLSGVTIPGWASIAFLILGTNAILFAFLGLLGEYTSRIYDQLKNRPASVFEEL